MQVMESGVDEADPNYITNGLYSMEDEDGISYYYRGTVENNNVQFGEYESDYYVYGSDRGYYQTKESCIAGVGDDELCQQVKLASAGDKMYWKIVRVNGDGSLRLIYNGTSTNPTNMDLANSYTIGSTPYNLESDDPKYTGYTYDRNTNETDSFIKREVDTWYKNTLGNSSYDSKVIGGRFCSDSSGYNYDGNGNFAGYDRLGQVFDNSAKSNAPTLKCPSTSESYGGSYRLKAGLITADELVLAGEIMYVVGDSYLNVGEGNYWSMTPGRTYLDFLYIFNISIPMGMPVEKMLLSIEFSYSEAGIRPVINVASENGFASGGGTSENPYIIQAE